MRGPKALATTALVAACALACATDPVRVPPLPEDAGAREDATVAPDAAPDATSGEPDATVGEPDATAAPDGAVTEPFELAPEVQRDGDPQRGYRALLDEGYVGCGIPNTAFSVVQGPAPKNLRLPGRNARNATLPYSYTRFTTTSSVDVVSANCLTCHASVFDGRVIMGLGNSAADFTGDTASTADLVGLLLNDPDEIAEWQKWASRVRTTSPYIRMPTRGVNPADNLAAILFAHRDRDTLAWSTTALLEPPPTEVVPVDVPAWWLLRYKSSMFYVGGGRGDHARIMMTASTLCVDTVAEADAIDAYFPDVRSYLMTLEAPPWPFAVDAAAATRGQDVFEASCARCHGTYGAAPSYPNLLVPLAEVGTDPALAAGAAQYSARFTDWFNNSWYGQRGRIEPNEGYVPAPLYGVWATAPYLHNASVPTLAALLDSSTRPTYWTRSFNTAASDYDQADLGWKTTVVDHGHADEPNAAQRTRIYDTTLPGYGNGGHLYGDALTPEERADLLEYLKTL